MQWSACKSKTEALYLDAGGTRLREVDVFKGMFAASRSADVYSAAGIFNSFSPVLLPSCGGKKKTISIQDSTSGTRMKRPSAMEAEVQFVRSEALLLEINRICKFFLW